MAIYRELEHHLYSLDVNLNKLAKIKADKQSDRDRRLREALGQSQSPEEALLKRCSHFTLDLDESLLKGDEAPDVCDFIHGLREQQLADCKRELKYKVLAASFMHRQAKKKEYYKKSNVQNEHFREWIRRVLKGEGAGDASADKFLRRLLEECGCSVESIGKAVNTDDKHRPEDVADFLAKPAKGENDYDYSIGRTTIIRDATVGLNRLIRELVGRIRSARYFGTVREILRKEGDDEEELAVLSCCGHFGPAAAVKAAVHRGKCIDDSCGAQVFIENVLTGEALGTDRSSGHYGYKLETLVTLIKQTPKDDRVLVFVQFDDLFDKVHEALARYEIRTEILQGTATAQARTLTSFQQKKGAKVLLLKATDSSSSGANLTMANWAFFVSPLLTDSKAKYKALSTQAIGRIHRYGQVKTAKIVHLLTHETKDVPIYANMNDLAENDVRGLIAKRKEIVPPKRERTGEWVARKKKAPAAKKKASPKKQKKAASEDDEEEESDAGDDDSEPDSDNSAPAARKPAAKRAANAKKPAGRGAKKALSIVISDDESEGEMSAESSDEEEPELSDDEESSEDERPKKKKATQTKKKPEDDYSASEDEDVAPSAASPSRKLPRRSAAATAKPIIIDSEEEESEDDEATKVTPTRQKTSVSASKAKGKAPAAQDSKKRRIIADSDDEEDEEPAAPKSSSSRSTAATAPALKKAKTSSTLIKAASSSASASKSSKSSQTTKISGVFDSLEIPSPKAKKQAQLYSFWKKDQAAKEAAPQPVREKKRKAEDDAPVEGKEAAVVPKKARQASPAAEAPRETSAAPAEAVAASTSASGADDVDASAGVEEVEQDSNKASTPSVNGSDETSGTGDAAVSTALTTPADELDKRLGDDVEEELAAMAAEEEV